MPFIVIDGPSGVGKTSLAKALCDIVPGSYLRHWHDIAKLRHSTAFDAIWGTDIGALNAGKVVVWEGSWAADEINQRLYNHASGYACSALFGEWHYGRLAQTCGVRVMLLAPSQTLALQSASSFEKRENADTRIERAFYDVYAQRWGWHKLSNDYTITGLAENILAILSQLPIDNRPELEMYPGYCGPLSAKVVVVGSAEKDDIASWVGAYLPFSGKGGMKLANFLDAAALEWGWAHARRVPPVVLRSARVLLATDREAEAWCYNHVAVRDVRLLPPLRTLFGGAKQQEHAQLFTDLIAEFSKQETKQR